MRLADGEILQHNTGHMKIGFKTRFDRFTGLLLSGRANAARAF
jgi:hypothetical protein